MFDSVVRVDPTTYESVPGLASGWSVEDLPFTIREALFSDGSPVTANDVAFTLLGTLHPDTGSPLAPNFSMIDGAEAYMAGAADSVSGLEVVDDRTLVITLTEPNAAFLFPHAHHQAPAGRAA